MIVFRIVVAALPQLLLLMLVGGRFDLLFGWNRTDGAFGVLIALFLVTPVATLALLVVEIVRRRRQAKRGAGTGSPPMVGLATFLFVEALAVNGYMLTQFRMH